MNNGKISIRYAKALLASATKDQVADKVYADMRTLCTSFEGYKQLQDVLANPSIDKKEKGTLIKASCGEKRQPLTDRFVDFILSQGREKFVYRMALMYEDLYRKERHIAVTQVTTAIEIPEALKKRIIAWVEKKNDIQVELRTKVDPSIIGGYILDYENTRLDASISGQLSKLNKYAGH